MAMLALAGCDGQSIVDNQVTIHMKTVGTATIDCQHEVEVTVNQMAAALGAERLEQACELADRAREDAKVSTHARLKSGTRKRI